jgi:Tetracyclin repressor-like, C-terminal domain
VGSQFIGLSMMRYITCIEPIASAPVDQLVAAVGPTVQRYLTGEIGAVGVSASQAPEELPASFTH